MNSYTQTKQLAKRRKLSPLQPQKNQKQDSLPAQDPDFGNFDIMNRALSICLTIENAADRQFLLPFILDHI